MLDNLSFTLPSLRSAYADGTSPAEVVAEVYRRIREVADPGIFIDLFDMEEVLAAAHALDGMDRSLPLWGIPFAIKDNIDVAGHPTTAACPAFAYVADEDAFAVARLKAAGALAIGKTNLDQFATGLVGVRTPYPVPRNAIDPDIVPGGSSSGSAVAVAHGLVSFSLGTDTAGSGRVPAALNNIAGLKPTLGAISASGLVPACRTLDTISIFALTVQDAHTVLEAVAAHDPHDAYSRAVGIAPLTPLPETFRVGVPDAATIEFFGDALQQASYTSDLHRLEEAGAELVALDFTPFHDIARLLYDGAWVAERHAVIEGLLTDNPDAVHPVTGQIIRVAETLTATDAFRGMYRLKELRAVADQLVKGVDLLCVPTIPTFYSVDDLAKDPIGPNARLGTYTNFVNLMDLCGIAVPTAQRTDGRPGSVTLLAGAGRDGWLASVAVLLERAGNVGATRHARPQPVIGAPRPGPEEMAIAVCGAHMSGLPLNSQLTSRGGRFLRTARTAEDYRLFALNGGPPERPGLVRDPAGGGSVPVEVWALPMAQVGSFLAGIPSPLGLGTLTLSGGETVTGFLCESHGLEGATELEAAAGWRGHLAAGSRS
ncbi:MAG: allophanate hydrolase [Minwuia sp.]|nr:allophanate hydrolase [Minwuia sp.]